MEIDFETTGTPCGGTTGTPCCCNCRCNSAAICWRRATSPTRSASRNVGSSDRQVVSSFLQFLQEIFSIGDTLHIDFFVINASLAATMVASCLKSYFFDLATYSSVALSLGLFQRGLQDLPLFCVLWLERSDGCLDSVDPCTCYCPRSCSRGTLQRLADGGCVGGFFDSGCGLPKLTLLGFCACPLRRWWTLATDHLQPTIQLPLGSVSS